MEFKTREEVLAFFEGGGVMLDTFERTVYISDVNADGEFFGIMVAEELPQDVCGNLVEACQYALDCIPAPGAFGAANRMGFMEPDSGWFEQFAKDVLAYPHEYVTE